MEVEGKEIELPLLPSNPFSTLPLEASQSHLLIGRVHQKNAMMQYIRYKSPRRVLLSGEMGSGRSSLLRCLSNHAPKSVHIDHIPHQNPALGLLREIYTQLTGTEAPSGWSQVVQKLVDASRTHTQSLPLVVIDAQGVEMNILSQALLSASAALNRVQCVLVVVIETMQKAQFPDQLLHMFDSDHHLEPFTIDEIQALVESRIKSVSDEAFVLSSEDARHLRDKTFGNPGVIIRSLRNAVDASLNPTSLAAIDRILTLTKPSLPIEEPTLEATPPEAPPSPEEPVDMDWAAAEELQTVVSEAAETLNDVPGPSQPSEQEDGEILDASMPWTERQSMRDAEDDVKIFDSMQGFELNLEQLDEQKSTDEDLPELPFKALPQTSEFDPGISDPGPRPINGMFKSIVGRIREVKAAPAKEETGTELWLAEGLEDGVAALPAVVEEEEPMESSGELIHDEVGFFEEVEDRLNEEIAHIEEELEVGAGTTTTDASHEQVAALTQAVQTLVSAISTAGKSSQPPLQRAFIDALAGLQHKPVANQIEHPLDVALLSNLSANEIAVLAVARERKFSPSDHSLLTDLGVKRSRLSQISSRLLKGGVLNARTVGRSRFYTMTSTAKAQLAAWGVQGGEA